MSSLQKINVIATQIFGLIILVLIFVSISVHTAISANRLSLVIGNSNYQHTSPLRNPANDADLIGSKLSEIGFDVLASKEISLSATRQVISEFAGKIRDVGEDAIVLFYYAGHGIQYNGKNFIVPVDANLQSVTDIILQGVDTSFILKIIELSGAKTNVVVLDACRNNPFPAVSRSVTKGLARMDSPSGSFIAYSIAPGAVALDGNGKNSPYTSALAEYITDPDLTLEAVFKKVRRKVYYDTEKAQTTWESTSLIDEVYLVERSDNAAKGAKIAVPNSTQNVHEGNFWNQIRNKGDAELFQTYLQMFPNENIAKLRWHKYLVLKMQPRRSNR
ncbi:MAG: caspase family protein [Hyphomicrobiales bacterium]|nr:caspase family protein [Hyphomicrobiales bacterium]